MASLFMNHKLNYFEALHQMAYWIDQMDTHNDPGGHILGRIRILQRALVRNAGMLYIDPKFVEPPMFDEPVEICDYCGGVLEIDHVGPNGSRYMSCPVCDAELVEMGITQRRSRDENLL